MTITVIGNITRDTLIFPKTGWRVVESLGGTLYTVCALASVSNHKVRLICNVGEDVYEDVVGILNKFPNVALSGIRKFQGNHFHCYILFASEYGTQYDEGIEYPVKYSQIKPFLDGSDILLISSMTGFDLDLPTLHQIKNAIKCPIYLDYHILSLQRDPLGNRYLKRRRNWLDWCSSCDYLQMNQFEAESLSYFPIRSENDIINFAKPILNKGVKSVAITLGKDGALVCSRDKAKRILASKIDGRLVENLVDPTGCGDVFAAGFIVSLMKQQNLLVAYQFANDLASKKCSFSGFEGFSEFIKNSQDPNS